MVIFEKNGFIEGTGEINEPFGMSDLEMETDIIFSDKIFLKKSTLAKFLKSKFKLYRYTTDIHLGLGWCFKKLIFHFEFQICL